MANVVYKPGSNTALAEHLQRTGVLMSNGHTPTYSHTDMTELVLPHHANPVGTVFGGQVMSWMDICGSVTCQRHSGTIVVTASVDELTFHAPIHVGNIVRIRGHLNAAFGTSMEVEVVVEVEDVETGERTLCVKAFLTFVAIHRESKTRVKVPALICETDAERTREKAAHERRAARLAKRNR